MNISATERRLPSSVMLEGQSSVFPVESAKYIPRILENRVVVETLAAFLDLRSIQELSQTCRITREITSSIGPSSLSVTRTPLAASGPCLGVFLRWGKFIQSLTLHATPFADRATLPTLLGFLPNLKKLTIQDCPSDPSQWDPDAVILAILSMPHLEELRLHYSDNMQYDESPYNSLVQAMASDVQYCIPPAAGGGASAQADVPGNLLILLSSNGSESQQTTQSRMGSPYYDAFHTSITSNNSHIHPSAIDTDAEMEYHPEPASTLTQTGANEAFPLHSVHSQSGSLISTFAYHPSHVAGQHPSHSLSPGNAHFEPATRGIMNLLPHSNLQDISRITGIAEQGEEDSDAMMETEDPYAVVLDVEMQRRYQDTLRSPPPPPPPPPLPHLQHPSHPQPSTQRGYAGVLRDEHASRSNASPVGAFYPTNPFLSPVASGTLREPDQAMLHPHSHPRTPTRAFTGSDTQGSTIPIFPTTSAVTERGLNSPFLDGFHYEYDPGYYPPYQLLQDEDASSLRRDDDEHEESLSTYDSSSLPFTTSTYTSPYTANPYTTTTSTSSPFAAGTPYTTATTISNATAPLASSLPTTTVMHPLHASYHPGSSNPSEEDPYSWNHGKGGFSISSRFRSPMYLSSKPFSRPIRDMRVSAKKVTRNHADSRKPLSRLKKLTLFTRLNVQATAALAKYLSDPERSKNLEKLKLSTSLISSPGGNEVLSALSHHHSLKKLTIMRPDGVGEPIRKSQCTLVAQAMANCKTLTSVHLRRAGMWFDTLASLIPPVVCPQIKNLKLDSNSLAYLSSGYFNDAMDTLLSRVPNLETLHLGNNQLDGTQAMSLANSIVRHKIDKLETLTLGSNNIGDRALAAILKALPPTMKQLYLHGCDIHNEGLKTLGAALDRMPHLWGLGLNGNPISDEGVLILCDAIRNRASLRDIGATLSEMTDEGVEHLSHALTTCKNLRFVYLYTSGFKASTKVTKEGREKLRARLPKFCTPAFDHRLSRYLKTP